MFPLLCENIKTSPHVNISEQIIQHPTQLSHKFDSYFPEDPRPGNLWILNPFTVNSATEDVALPLKLENELIELSEGSLISNFLKILRSQTSISKSRSSFILDSSKQGIFFIIRTRYQISIAIHHHLSM